MICFAGDLTKGQDQLSALQTRIKEAEDSIADLKDKNAALQKEVKFSSRISILYIINNSLQIMMSSNR